MENSDNKFGIVMEKPKTEPPNNDVLNYDSNLSPQCHTVVSELLDLTKCDRLDGSGECEARTDSSANWSPPEGILRQALMSFATAEEKTMPCYEHGKDDLKDTDEIFHVEDLKIFPPNFFNDNVAAKAHQLDPQQFTFFPSENNPLIPDTLSNVSQVCPLNNTTFIAVPSFVPSSSVANLSDSSQLSYATSIAQHTAPPQSTPHFPVTAASLSNKCDGSLCDMSLPSSNAFVPKQDTTFPSSKDVTMDVAFSTVPKTENNLTIDDSVPLPLLSNLKSSLSQDIPENHSNPSNLDREVLTTTLSSSAAFNSVTDDEDVPKFLDSGVSDVCVAENGIKIDIKSDDSSDFSHNTLMPLPDSRHKNSVSQSTLLPMSGNMILNKNEHSTSVEQVIAIPNTVCGSELNIPLSVPVSSDNVHVCNSVVSGDSAQVTSVRDPRIGQTPSWQNHGISVATLSSARDRMLTECSVFGPNTAATNASGINVTAMTQATGALQLSDTSAQSADISVESSQSSATDQVTSVVTSFSALDTSSYSVQSPAEILSQLSRAGAFPAMTSSQVSSVLSALNSEFNHDGETDSGPQDELSNEQVLQAPMTVEKVSTPTQTEDISFSSSICQENKKTTDVHSPTVVSDHPENTTSHSCKGIKKPEVKDGPDTVSTQDMPALVNHIPLYTKIVAIILKTTQAEVKKSAISVDHSNAKTSTGGPPIVSANATDVAQKKEETTSSPPRITKKESVSVKPKSKLLNEERQTNAKLSSKLKKKKPKNNWSKPNRNCSARLVLTKNSAAKLKRRKKPKQNDDSYVSKFVEKVFCYKCKFCPFISLQKSAVSLHIEKEHSASVEASSGSIQLKCVICQRVYDGVTLLKEHLLSVHKLSDEKAKDLATSSLYRNKNVVLNRDAEKEATIVDKSLKNGSSEINMNIVENSEKPKDKISMEKSRIRVKKLESEKVLFSEVSSVKEKDTAEQEVASFNGHGNDCTNSTILDPPTANLTDVAQQNEDIHKVNSYNYKPAWLQCRVLVKEDGAVETADEKLKMARKRGRPKGSRNQLTSGTSRKKVSANSTNEKEIGFSCNIDNCAVRMRSLENIEYHRRCHNGAQYSCPECSHVHCHWNGMSTHLWRTHVINMELFSCDQCSYKTTSYSKLINMHKRIHGSERPFLCDTCGKGFKNTKQLRNHRSIHYASSKTRQEHEGECDVCGRTFSTLRKLRLHKDNVHHKVRRHLCSNCGYCASSISSLKMHMRQHTGEKPFKCNECDYQTSDHNSLRRHKMRHTGAKPYKCPHCTYACIQSSTYKAHIKTKHPGLDNGLMFSCNECNFHTVKEDNYLAHLGEHKLGTFPANKKLKKLQEEDNGGFSFDMPFESDYVAHLVEPLLVDSSGMRQHLPELSVRAVENIADIQFDPGPANEHIVGDFQEPRELKFSVLEQAAP